MHYYPHHVGDYQRDTAHLSIVEHGVYRLLMDSYYSTERPLPADHAILCRIVRATSRAERDAVAAVSRLFFEQRDGTLIHNRIECELALYQTQREAASKAGKASAAKRNSVTKGQRQFNARSTPVAFPLERNVNGEGNETSTESQPTKNQEPRTNVPPIAPKGAKEEKQEDLVLEVPPNDPPPFMLSFEQMEVSRWFHRRPTTPWSEKELKAWKEIHFDEDDMKILGWFYTQSGCEYLRKDLKTLLNNWRGEVDRARKFAAEQS